MIRVELRCTQTRRLPGSGDLCSIALRRVVAPYYGWNKAAGLIVNSMDGAISAKTVTYACEHFMRALGDMGVTKVKCSEFADAAI